MSETYHTEAIILKKESRGEADCDLIVFGRECGKKFLVARGAKKPGAKLAGHIEPFNKISLMVVRGRQRDYAGSGVNLQAFLGIKKDLNRLFWAGKALNFFEKSVRTEESDSAEELFDLLDFYLELFNKKEENPEIVFYGFVYNLICRLGFEPDLNRCRVCGCGFEDQGEVFDFVENGVFCQKCSTESKNTLTLSSECVSLLKDLRKNLKIKNREERIVREAIFFIGSLKKFFD